MSALTPEREMYLRSRRRHPSDESDVRELGAHLDSLRVELVESLRQRDEARLLVRRLRPLIDEPVCCLAAPADADEAIKTWTCGASAPKT